MTNAEIPAKPTAGTPIVLKSIHGSIDKYLFLAEDGNGYAVARDGHGNYQGLKRSDNALNGWKCVKVPNASYEKAWQWARGN